MIYLVRAENEKEGARFFAVEARDRVAAETMVREHIATDHIVTVDQSILYDQYDDIAELSIV